MAIIRQMEVEGYGTCRCGCGRKELHHVLFLTRGLAWPCFRDGRVSKITSATVVSHGALIELTLNKPKKRLPRARTGSQSTQQKAHAAREAARKRLAKLYPDVYELLYNDERQARGLPIVPSRREGKFADTAATNLQGVFYPSSAEPGDQDAHAQRTA